jgi:hypothetical protein
LEVALRPEPRSEVDHQRGHAEQSRDEEGREDE